MFEMRTSANKESVSWRFVSTFQFTGSRCLSSLQRATRVRLAFRRARNLLTINRLASEKPCLRHGSLAATPFISFPQKPDARKRPAERFWRKCGHANDRNLVTSTDS
jgi:hypothetical protein